VDRDPHRTHLLSDGTSDGLSNPPTGISAEFIAAPIIEFLDRFHQPDVPFLD
jgi:hypothetical protein